MDLRTSVVCVSIIGAGIGGLAAAAALRDAGFDVGVYEQAIALADEGAGIQITPNAGRVLCHLGLRPALEADAFEGGRFAFRHYRTGEVLRIMDFANSAQLTGIPYWRIHRADLQRALLTALAQRSPDALHLGYRVTGVAQNGKQVTIVSSDGRRVVSDIVVAADGIRSTVRTMLFAQDQPDFSGYVAWRGLVLMARLSDRLRSALSVSFGGGRTIVNYRIRRGELMNFAAFAHREAWEEEGWRIRSSLNELQSAFSDSQEAAHKSWLSWRRYRRPQLSRFVNPSTTTARAAPTIHE